MDRPPAGPDWLHEVKHDGYRILARKDGERVKLWTRRGTEFTDRLSKIADAVRGLPVEQVLIDAEAVVFRADGRNEFAPLLTKEGGARASYVAFDLLELDGKDVREAPLEDRRAKLQRIVTNAAGILFSEAVAGKGELVFRIVCEMGLEGIVSKRAGSRYPRGASRAWRKCKNPAFVRT